MFCVVVVAVWMVTILCSVWLLLLLLQCGWRQSYVLCSQHTPSLQPKGRRSQTGTDNLSVSRAPQDSYKTRYVCVHDACLCRVSYRIFFWRREGFFFFKTMCPLHSMLNSFIHMKVSYFTQHFLHYRALQVGCPL